MSTLVLIYVYIYIYIYIRLAIYLYICICMTRLSAPRVFTCANICIRKYTTYMYIYIYSNTYASSRRNACLD